MHSEPLGPWGERRAAEYLRQCDYKLVATHFENTKGYRLGEIDIVAKKGDELVFVEVKTRTASPVHPVTPEESVTPRKLRRLDRIIQVFLNLYGLRNQPWRLDVVAIIVDPESQSEEIKHIKNVFL